MKKNIGFLFVTFFNLITFSQEKGNALRSGRIWISGSSSTKNSKK
jgi:hypothetical protein